MHMFSGILGNVAREKASMLRDAEYISENVKDSRLQEAMLIYETCDKTGKLCTEDNIIPPEEREQIKEAIEKIPETSNSEEEIDRILSKEGGSIGIDDIRGIENEDTGETVLADIANTMDDCLDNK